LSIGFLENERSEVAKNAFCETNERKEGMR